MASPRGALQVLFVTPYVPSRLRPRPFHLIRQLARRGHRVVLFSIATTREEAAQAECLRDCCERVEVVRVPPGRSFGNCLAGLLTRYPLQACYCDAPRMRALIREAVPPGRLRPSPGTAGFSADIVHVEHLRAVRFALDLPPVARVYDSVDCISLLLDRAIRGGSSPGTRLRSWIDRGRTRRFEARLLGRIPRILVAAERDREALAALGGPGGGPAAKLSVVPSGVDCDHFRTDGRPRETATLLFVGRLGYHANVSAASYLVEQIMPRVWAERPDARVILVGADPARRVRALARHRRVEVTGSVPDVRPWLARATVSVNPLPYAVGMQSKVLEAMAMEVPVVATTAACGGLRVADGTHLLLADEPAMFARRIVELLGDPDRGRRLAAHARAYVAAHHDWAESGALLEDIYRAEIARVAADQPTSSAAWSAGPHGPEAARSGPSDRAPLGSRGGPVSVAGRRGSADACARLVKDVADRLGAALLLALAAPVLAVIALLIRLDSPGPILYRRRVVGRHGVPFDAFKFRTMIPEADRALDRSPALRREFERRMKLTMDPRVTRVGRWLRPTSLDELPQLLNVLAGQMSLVGPRILTAEELARYGDRREALLSVRPGMTGLWQVSGRGGLDYETRIELDMRYVAHWSLRRDLAILAQTLPAVVRRRGAY